VLRVGRMALMSFGGWVSATGLFGPCASLLESGDDMSSVTKDVESQMARWYKALLKGDANEVALLYAEDAILLSTLGQGVHVGRTQIRQYFSKKFLPRHPVGSTLEPYTRLLGGVAVNSGLYSFVIDKKPAEGKGRMEVTARYTFVYRWSGTDWVIVEHHSSVMPPEESGKKAMAKRKRSVRR
jgi:uncharacterized protein (TIGR02246 family)